MPFTSETAVQAQAKRKTKKGFPKHEPKEGENLNEVAEIINNSAFWFDMKPCKTDDEVEERIRFFFDKIAKSGEFPSIEKLALALGVTRRTLTNWEHGDKGTYRAELIMKAKELLAAIDVELAGRRKLDSVNFIFRAKNFYGYRDTVEHEIIQTSLYGDDVDHKQLAQKYKAALPNDQ